MPSISTITETILYLFATCGYYFGSPAFLEPLTRPAEHNAAYNTTVESDSKKLTVDPNTAGSTTGDPSVKPITEDHIPGDHTEELNTAESTAGNADSNELYDSDNSSIVINNVSTPDINDMY